MKIAVIGNTKQTLKGLNRLIEEEYQVSCVFGLPEDKSTNKVNFVSLCDLCLEHNISLDTSNNWDNLLDLELDQGYRKSRSSSSIYPRWCFLCVGENAQHWKVGHLYYGVG